MKPTLKTSWSMFCVLTLCMTACNSNPSQPAQQQPAPAASAPGPAPIPGPVPGTRLTEGYAAQVARTAYFWAWPMANIYNRVETFQTTARTGVAERHRSCCTRESIRYAHRLRQA